MQLNKVDHVKTIGRVAEDLGESEDWLFQVATEMEPEDGLIWVYGLGDDGVMAFSDFGVENLIELIKIYKDDPALLRRGLTRNSRAAVHGRILTEHPAHRLDELLPRKWSPRPLAISAQAA